MVLTVVVHTNNPSRRQREAGHPQLQGQLEANLDYMRPCQNFFQMVFNVVPSPRMTFFVDENRKRFKKMPK